MERGGKEANECINIEKVEDTREENKISFDKQKHHKHNTGVKA